MDIFIMDNSPEEYEALKKICLKILIGRNYEGEIYRYSEENTLLAASLFMLAFGEQTADISQRVRSMNPGSYVVVLLDSYGELGKAVTPVICPSGFLIKPYRDDDVERILDEIYADHRRCIGSEKLGSFSFKQKSKEFSIPFERIILFESRNKKIIVRTEIQEFEFYGTLDSVMQSVPDSFLQIHKSFVVNLSRIVSADYGAMTVEFDDGSEAYMSRTYKAALKERLSGRDKLCSLHT